MVWLGRKAAGAGRRGEWRRTLEDEVGRGRTAVRLSDLCAKLTVRGSARAARRAPQRTAPAATPALSARAARVRGHSLARRRADRPGAPRAARTIPPRTRSEPRRARGGAAATTTTTCCCCAAARRPEAPSTSRQLERTSAPKDPRNNGSMACIWSIVSDGSEVQLNGNC